MLIENMVWVAQNAPNELSFDSDPYEIEDGHPVAMRIFYASTVTVATNAIFVVSNHL